MAQPQTQQPAPAKPFRPMLAADAPKTLTFPLFASAKLDGVRAVVRDNQLVSRALKPIRNQFTQGLFGLAELNGMDGELTVGPANAKNVMQATTSGVMSTDGEPDVTYWVFDFWTAQDMPFHERHRAMERAFKDHAMDRHPRIKLLKQTLIHDQAELEAYEAVTLAQGFEGVILRRPDSGYKWGRSTAREAWLLKLKRYKDSEAVVTGFIELMHNGNEQVTDNLGLAMRSTQQDGLVPMDTLGALVVRDVKTGIEFHIGTGFNDQQRARIWANRDNLKGTVVKYKYFPHGVKEKPRHPVYLGPRHPDDM